MLEFVLLLTKYFFIGLSVFSIGIMAVFILIRVAEPSGKLEVKETKETIFAPVTFIWFYITSLHTGLLSLEEINFVLYMYASTNIMSLLIIGLDKKNFVHNLSRRIFILLMLYWLYNIQY